MRLLLLESTKDITCLGTHGSVGRNSKLGPGEINEGETRRTKETRWTHTHALRVASIIAIKVHEDLQAGTPYRGATKGKLGEYEKERGPEKR